MSIVDMVVQAAQRYGLDPQWFAAQLDQESGLQHFRPDGSVIVSPAGALGIGQLMPETARGLGVDPNDPEDNLDGAARFMRFLLDRYEGDQIKAMVAYNAGPGRVDAAVETYGDNWIDGVVELVGDEPLRYINAISAGVRTIGQRLADVGGGPMGLTPEEQALIDQMAGGGGKTRYPVPGAPPGFFYDNKGTVYYQDRPYVDANGNPLPVPRAGADTPKFERAEGGLYRVMPDGSLRLEVPDAPPTGRAPSPMQSIRGDDGTLYTFNPNTGTYVPQIAGGISPDTAARLAADAEEAKNRIAQADRQLEVLKAQHEANLLQGKRQDAIQIAQLIAMTENQRNNDMMQLAGLVQADESQRASREISRLAQRQSVARDIGEFAKSPGDVGKQAAFLQANPMGAPISEAIARGDTAITPESLAPLELMLQQKDELSKLEQPGQFATLLNALLQRAQNEPGASRLIESLIGAINAPPGSAMPPLAGAGAAGSTVGPGGGALQPAIDAWKASRNLPVGGSPTSFEQSLAGMSPEGLRDELAATLPAEEFYKFFGNVGAARKPMTGAAATPANPFAALFAGQELPIEQGEIPVFPAATGLNGTVTDPTLILAGEGGPEKVNIEPITGSAEWRKQRGIGSDRMSILSGASGGSLAASTGRASSFLDRAYQSALARTPFTETPTPLSMARPGMSPFLRQLAAALAATGRGISPELFEEEARNWTPMGLPQGFATARTR